MKLKNFMIVALWLIAHSCAAQTIRYWVGCTVSHEHGQQCFKEFISELKTEITGASGDSIVYGQAVPLDSATSWLATSWIVAEEIMPKFGWITDSITWVATDTTSEGNYGCVHEWVHGEPEFFTKSSSFICAVDHNGGHCDYDDDVREKICRNCLFSVIEREKWFQRFVAPPKSEFELLKEKQRAKQ